MVKLRLRRMGRKSRPVYDIVATDSRAPRDGRFIEKIGQYNPVAVAGQVTLKRERAIHWLNVGAQPSDTVRSLFRREGLMLELHLNRKGKEGSEIAQQVENHQARTQNRESRDLAALAEQQRERMRIEEEAARAKEQEVRNAREAAAREAAAAAAAENAPAASEEAAPAAEEAASEAPAAEAAPEESAA